MRSLSEIFFSPNRKFKDTIRSLEDFARSGDEEPRCLTPAEVARIVEYLDFAESPPSPKPADPKPKRDTSTQSRKPSKSYDTEFKEKCI